MAITLAAARVNKRLTRQKAARELGICASTLKNYENGKTFPNVATLQKIEKLYELAGSDIIFLT